MSVIRVHLQEFLNITSNHDDRRDPDEQIPDTVELDSAKATRMGAAYMKIAGGFSQLLNSETEGRHFHKWSEVFDPTDAPDPAIHLVDVHGRPILVMQFISPLLDEQCQNGRWLYFEVNPNAKDGWIDFFNGVIVQLNAQARAAEGKFTDDLITIDTQANMYKVPVFNGDALGVFHRVIQQLQPVTFDLGSDVGGHVEVGE